MSDVHLPYKPRQFVVWLSVIVGLVSAMLAASGFWGLVTGDQIASINGERIYGRGAFLVGLATSLLNLAIATGCFLWVYRTAKHKTEVVLGKDMITLPPRLFSTQQQLWAYRDIQTLEVREDDDARLTLLIKSTVGKTVLMSDHLGGRENLFGLASALHRQCPDAKLIDKSM